jgi:hypothetical protein
MTQDRHKWRNPGTAADEQERSAVLRTPREVTAERAADLNRVADLGNIVEEGGDLATLEALDGELVEPLQLGRRRDRIASLYLISIWCSEPDIEVLAGPKGTPVLGAKEEALHPRCLALDPFDHGLLPRNVTCLDDRVCHGQSPE